MCATARFDLVLIIKPDSLAISYLSVVVSMYKLDFTGQAILNSQEMVATIYNDLNIFTKRTFK
ncbi:hypothetical protein CWB85_01545 [Pseudoalteromonas sp. S1727]|nr:hypothetical protein CWB85_01545 [Pseudoalteromonas sp. S1727]